MENNRGPRKRRGRFCGRYLFRDILYPKLLLLGGFGIVESGKRIGVRLPNRIRKAVLTWSLPLLKYESSSATSSGRPHTSSPSREPLSRGVIKPPKEGISLRNLRTLILFEQRNIFVGIGHHELQNHRLLRCCHTGVKRLDQSGNLRHGGETRRNQLRKRCQHCYSHLVLLIFYTFNHVTICAKY